MVWDLVCQQRRRLCLEFLPAYAPELNPVEYLWHTGSTMSYRTSVPTAMENSATMLAKLLRRMGRRSMLVCVFGSRQNCFRCIYVILN